VNLTPLAAALTKLGLRSGAVAHRVVHASWGVTGALLLDLLFCGTRRW